MTGPGARAAGLRLAKAPGPARPGGSKSDSVTRRAVTGRAQPRPAAASESRRVSGSESG